MKIEEDMCQSIDDDDVTSKDKDTKMMKNQRVDKKGRNTSEDNRHP